MNAYCWITYDGYQGALMHHPAETPGVRWTKKRFEEEAKRRPLAYYHVKFLGGYGTKLLPLNTLSFLREVK